MHPSELSPAIRLARLLREDVRRRGLSRRMAMWYRDHVPESVRGWLARVRSCSPLPRFGEEGLDELHRFLHNPHARLVFPTCVEPLVSIVVLNYNRAAELLDCLRSIRACTNDVAYELIVADNASTDRAPEVLRRLDNALVVSHAENLGFVRGNNAAVRHARGRYLLLLNNDTVVTPGWLSSLVRTIESWPDCGIVGPRFLWPDGRLQEAGGICWADGRVMQYGIDGDPTAPEFQHVREVDYVSGACLLVRAELFRSLSGFDERYAPCYYEDVDLCFAARSRGLSVAYQPDSIVFHHGPSGASTTRDRCRDNRARFVRKWAEALKQRIVVRATGDILAARDLRPGTRVLIVDGPESSLPDLSALAGNVVTFAPLEDPDPDSIHRLRQAGIEVLPARDVLERRRGCFESTTIRTSITRTNLIATTSTYG